METNTPSAAERGNHLSDGKALSRLRMTLDRRKRLTGILSVLGAVVLWSSSYVVIKVGVEDIAPLTYAAIRFLFAVILLLGLSSTVIRLEPAPGKDLRRLALGGLLGITAYFSLQNLGIQRTSAAEATLLVAAFPVITLLLEVLLRRARVSFKQIAGVVIAIGGIALIIEIAGLQDAPDRLTGDALLLLTGIAWALYNFATQDVVKKYSTFTVIFWQTLFGMLALLPLALSEAPVWRPLSPQVLFGALFLGIFCSVGAFLLYGYGLKSLRPGLAVNLLNLVPVFGLIFAALFLREQVGWRQIIGGLVVIAGVTLSLSASARDRAGRTEPEAG